MRPQIKPALRRVWRDGQTVQIGLDPAHSLVVTGLDAGLRHLVESLSGACSEEDLITAALAEGVSLPRAHRLLRLLDEAGALQDAASAEAVWEGVGPAERERLTPDLAARRLGTSDADGEWLRRRRDAAVCVFGAGRIGASVAALLAAGGLGRVDVSDRTVTRPADLAPAGLCTGDVGRPRAVGAARAAKVAGPSTEVGAGGVGGTTERPDLAVLAPDEEPDRNLADALVRAGVPHLVVRMREGRAILGPFVLPGTSSCVRCHDLHRTARDPRWPDILAQTVGAPSGVPACDVVLATAVAGHAVLHVLAFIDGGRPPSVDATLEMTVPHGTIRRRSWSTHPACGCNWDPEPAPVAA
ncbi:ThiF family adenylyltransferase [Actinopolymorpha rutila]|uniref:THIF-type NAD/FAD binding fold domain-containing protein n=1 Tax=Actinopolymorpha rutila TaxID=446787 RepID=A0A852Z7N6_9ACTN|nr:hypothetical protein [Actinopolymorpha rutila]